MSLRDYLSEEFKGYTSINMGALGEHNHPYTVDNFGNGSTDPDNTKHEHKINEFSVQPGGEDAHGHMIKNPMQEALEAVDDGELRKALQVMLTIATQIEDSITGLRNLRKMTKAHRGKELKRLETDLKKSLNSAKELVISFERDFS